MASPSQHLHAAFLFLHFSIPGSLRSGSVGTRRRRQAFAKPDAPWNVLDSKWAIDTRLIQLMMIQRWSCSPSFFIMPYRASPLLHDFNCFHPPSVAPHDAADSTLHCIHVAPLGRHVSSLGFHAMLFGPMRGASVLVRRPRPIIPGGSPEGFIRHEFPRAWYLDGCTSLAHVYFFLIVVLRSPTVLHSPTNTPCVPKWVVVQGSHGAWREQKEVNKTSSFLFFVAVSYRSLLWIYSRDFLSKALSTSLDLCTLFLKPLTLRTSHLPALTVRLFAAAMPACT